MYRLKLLPVSIVVASLSLPLAAHAQEAPAGTDQPTTVAEPAPAPAIAVSGSVGIASDYRFRGVSQSDRQIAVQGGLTLTHESGLYAGIWGSNLAGWGTFGGANLELDLIAGYKAKLADNATLDVGAVYYVYPGGADTTEFLEPYAKLTGTTGPATLTAGIAYAPKQKALGRWYATGADAAAGTFTDPGDREDNLYLWGDAAVGISGTPFTAKAHIGHSKGNDGLGPNATSLSPTGSYWDWSLGVDTTWRNLTLGVAWVDTDIPDRDAAYLQPSFSKGQDGTGSIAGSTLLVSLTAGF
ncbi:hypothetical protein DMC47_24680 [Nostoc sp. 3335mG]|nr:hypothetical protein DMC47_24680 [Nostoc sp. 3335mG]